MSHLIALLCVCLLALSAAAESYPKGPVRMLVPFPPGGGVDAAGRLLAQALTDSVGKPFVIENRGGANGNIGTEVAARATADGYTLLFTGAGFVTNRSLYKKVPYDPLKDFEPISLMALGPNILVVHPSLPVHTVQELIAAAKARPGEIGFAGSGSGSTPHLAGELFNHMAGVQLVHVPYRGSGPAMIGLLAGDAPVMFLPAINAGPHIAAGKLRALAVTSRERLAAFPDVPTVAESGLPGYESSQWYGLLAPVGTPHEIGDFLTGQVMRIMRAPEMKARMTRDGLVALGSTREEFAAHIRSELEKWARVIRASGASVD